LGDSQGTGGYGHLLHGIKYSVNITLTEYQDRLLILLQSGKAPVYKARGIWNRIGAWRLVRWSMAKDI